ncbi:MAG: hypothetical protein F6K50_23875 [Moorea sp. SIO3I7]|uniref:hypothetical protein n=1 Tax=Moorena sp. SIO3I6 TaxID=2607831 RepID=UPI0013CD3E76|nr:hypothetical protein [Moorena sp. SIO3I6]NEN98439.1 hypothetical protein [Moorena sp. SIO3I7]NEP28191.1 hypothetical protein [Moorena sp. SIO3I6]
MANLITGKAHLSGHGGNPHDRAASRQEVSIGLICVISAYGILPRLSILINLELLNSLLRGLLEADC